MRKHVLYALAGLLTLAVPAMAAEHPQKAGKWQTKVEMEMPGMPMKMPPMTFDVCVTEEDLEDPQKSVPQDPKSDCKVGDYKIDGNSASWTIDCPKQKMKGSGHAEYSGDSYKAVMDMTMGEQAMKMTYTGKWLGECKK
jgi:hypothetical protein